MSFFDDVLSFGEGAWESVSTGVGDALGDWAGTGFSGSLSDHVKNVDDQSGNQNQVQNQPVQQTAVSDPAPAAAPVFMGFSKKELVIGGGLFVAVLIVAVKV